MSKSLFKFVTVLSLLVVVALVSCKQEKPQGPQPTGYELNRSDRDTTAVTELVDKFFGYLETGYLVDAVSMLYKMDEDNVMAEPQLLDNDQLKKVMKTYRMLMPVRGHRIDYIKFREAYDNEVKVTVILEEAHDGLPEMTTTVYFKPYDYLTSWRLCTFNTLDGNQRIISNSQADSMQNHYADEMNAKEAVQVQQ